AEPSPIAHEILNGKPYTYLDDAPLEERRTRAVALRRGLPESARELGRLDPEAIARVREEARPDPRDSEELHDTLLSLGVMRPVAGWWGWREALARAGRAGCAMASAGPLWLAAERRPLVEALFPGASIAPDVRVLAARSGRHGAIDPERAAIEVTRGHLAVSGPTTAGELAARTGLTPALVTGAPLALAL